jgi:hypothetical protein
MDGKLKAGLADMENILGPKITPEEADRQNWPDGVPDEVLGLRLASEFRILASRHPIPSLSGEEWFERMTKADAELGNLLVRLEAKYRPTFKVMVQ